jgi:DNA-binding CsgD family transcriptional regulator
MRSVAVPSAHRGMSAEELGHAALRIAGCRSLTALRDALFSQADSIIGVVAMGLYLFDGANRLQLISNRLAPLGFLDEYEREFCKSDTMLDCIIAERRTVDGFHFHGPARWRRSGNYDLLRGWGFYHNMGGAFVVNGRAAGALFVATARETEPFDAIHVKRLDLLCRAGSLALTAMEERERPRCDLRSNSASADGHDLSFAGRNVPGELLESGDERPIDRLPARSREVARLLCQGQPNKVIASQLGISVYTVKEHVQNLCRRFGALNRTELAHRLSKSS